MVVYTDVLIFLNGIITYFLLLCVCSFFKFRPKTYRLIIGALIGGFSALTIFLPRNLIFGIFVRVAICTIIILSTFSYHNKIRFLKFSLAFLTVTYIFGGGVMALIELTNTPSAVYKNGVAYFDIEPLFLIISSGLIYLFIRFLLLFKKQTPSENEIFDCTVEFENVKVSFLAINDTGNSLVDPYFNNPVVLIEEKTLKPILSLSPKTYLIPLKSVIADGTIFAFRPTAFFIEKDGRRYRKNDVTIGIAKTKLHNSFDGILSPQIIEIGEENLCLTKQKTL